MTQQQPQTMLPKALRARAEALTAAVNAANQAGQGPQPTQPQPSPEGAPSNIHVLPAAPQAQPAQEQPAQAQPEPEFDLSLFAVEGTPAEPAQPAQPAAAQPAAPATPQPNSEIARLEQRIADLQAAVQAPAAGQPAQAEASAAAKALLEIQSEDLTDQERETYKAAIPVVQKLLNQALATQVAPKINEFHKQVSERDQRIEQLQQEVERTRSSSFQDRVRSAVPDIDTLTKDPAFSSYMDTPVPIMGAGATVRSALANAVKTQDVNAVQAIVNQFRGANPAQPTPAPQAAFVSPGSSPSPVAAPATPTAKPTLKLSARLKAGRDFTSGRITKAQLDKIDAIYDEAMRDGRVAMDK